jgi:hypothetical protein
MALGPGIPDPPPKTAVFHTQKSRHWIAESLVVLSKSVLAGLHHEYSYSPVPYLTEERVIIFNSSNHRLAAKTLGQALGASTPPRFSLQTSPRRRSGTKIERERVGFAFNRE